MIDINGLISGLSSIRQIFHSEADFQHALAWRIHEAMPDCRVRLEYPLANEDKRIYLDIWLPDKGIAIELKYHTKRLELDWDGEPFALREQSAHDILRYDFLKDLQRLERLVAEWNACKAGFAVLLTNNPLLWDKERSRQGNVDSAFHLYDGRRIAGELAWSNRARAGTTKNRELPINLKGLYNLLWQDYSTLPSSRCGDFRYLAVKV